MTSSFQLSPSSTTSSAPACSATLRFSSLETIAIVRAPSALGDLQRGRADAAGGAVDEHRLARLQPPAHDERRSRRCGS